MINIKKVSIIALILLLVGIIGSLLSFGHANKCISFSEVKTIDEENIRNIQLEVGNAGVDIIPTKSTETKIEFAGLGTSDTKRILSSVVQDNTLLNKDQSCIY